MPRKKVLFGNFFAPVPNFRFRKLVVSALQRLPDGHRDLVGPLQAKFEVYDAGLDEVDRTDTEKVGLVSESDVFLDDFKAFMRTAAPGILWVAKSKKAPLYTDFFPKGVREYSRAAKESASVLMARVRAMAVKHGALLPPDMAAGLQAFEGGWERVYDKQEAGKGAVDRHRVDRSESRLALELETLTVLHTVAARNPGNEAACAAIFDLSLLRAPRRYNAATAAAGSLPAEAVAP
ncbi:MAG: hypothetical protein EOO11_15415 [Chitinophagaceae bacterium]|nr:MAG: hypothetical protein EOO11_15415 [Chitinophagaceae bacterium]